MRKKPCGLLWVRAKNKKNEKKALWLLETRVKIRESEKTALRSVDDEGENQEK